MLNNIEPTIDCGGTYTRHNICEITLHTVDLHTVFDHLSMNKCSLRLFHQKHKQRFGYK